MKRLYLSRIDKFFTSNYFIANGAFNERKIHCGKDNESIIKYLKNNVDKKRKTEFYLESSSIPENLINSVSKMFSGTKVKVSIEDKFE